MGVRINKNKSVSVYPGAGKSFLEALRLYHEFSENECNHDAFFLFSKPRLCLPREVLVKGERLMRSEEKPEHTLLSSQCLADTSCSKGLETELAGVAGAWSTWGSETRRGREKKFKLSGGSGCFSEKGM